MKSNSPRYGMCLNQKRRRSNKEDIELSLYKFRSIAVGMGDKGKYGE
jgi:hypothetical protein